MTRTISMCCVILAGAIGLSGCAGDMIYARNAAKKANGFVGDMHRTTNNAIEKQRGAHQGDEARIADLTAMAEIRKASSRRHVATWQAADAKASLEIYQSMLALTADEDLTKTAPFVIMAPLPEYNAPAINDKSFTDLMTKLAKLSQKLSPMARVNALIPFVKAAVKAYGDSAEKASNREVVKPATGSATVKAQEGNATRLLAVPPSNGAAGTRSYETPNDKDRFLTLTSEGSGVLERDLKIIQPVDDATTFSLRASGQAPQDTSPTTSLMNALQ